MDVDDERASPGIGGAGTREVRAIEGIDFNGQGDSYVTREELQRAQGMRRELLRTRDSRNNTERDLENERINSEELRRQNHNLRAEVGEANRQQDERARQLQHAEKEYEQLVYQNRISKNQIDALNQRRRDDLGLIRKQNEQLREIRPQAKSNEVKVKIYQDKEDDCLNNWQNFEVEQSRRNLMEENRQLKDELAMGINTIREMDSSYARIMGTISKHGMLGAGEFDYAPSAAKGSIMDLTWNGSGRTLASECDEVEMREDTTEPADTVMENSQPRIGPDIVIPSGESELDIPLSELCMSIAESDLDIPISLLSLHSQDAWKKLILRRDSSYKQWRSYNTAPESPRKLARIEGTSDTSLKTGQSGDQTLPLSVRDIKVQREPYHDPNTDLTGRQKDKASHRGLKRQYEDNQPTYEDKQPIFHFQPQIQREENSLKHQATEEEEQSSRFLSLPFRRFTRPTDQVVIPTQPDSGSAPNPDPPPEKYEYIDHGPPQPSIHPFRRYSLQPPPDRGDLRLSIWCAAGLAVVLFIFFYIYAFIQSALETRRWIKANEVPPHVMDVLRNRRGIANSDTFQMLDYYIGEWLEIDRVALG